MNIDTTCIAEQLSATFNLDVEQVEIEIILLQNVSRPTRLHQTFGALLTQKSTVAYAQQLSRLVACLGQPIFVTLHFLT